LIDSYLATHSNGTIEESSLSTARTHLNQFAQTIGKRFRMQALTLLDLQGHVERLRKNGVSPVTLKKEMATVRACWTWAVHGSVPNCV
jgi:site-specific recombinase XerD